MNLKKIFSSILLLNLANLGIAKAEVNLESVEERVYNLEKKLENRSPVLPMDADKFRLGGFLTSTWAYLENDSGADNNSETAFTSNRFELLLGMDITENLEFFTAFGIISSSSFVDQDPERSYAQNKASNNPHLIISHGTWKWGRHANLKFGRFIAPVGIINIEHFPPGLFLEDMPQMLLPLPGGSFWNNFLNGLDFYGNIDVGSSNLSYHLNYSSFSFLPGNETVAGDPEKELLGGRLAWNFMEHYTLGTSFQIGERGPRAANISDNKGYQNYGIDFFVSQGNFNLKAEYAIQDVESGKGLTDKESYYIQPSYGISPTVRLVYRYDFIDNDTDTSEPNAVAKGQAKEKTIHTLGVNWTPVSTLRLRAEYQIHDFEAEQITDASNLDPDYDKLIVSGVLSF